MVHHPLKITLALTFDDYKAPDFGQTDRSNRATGF